MFVFLPFALAVEVMAAAIPATVMITIETAIGTVIVTAIAADGTATAVATRIGIKIATGGMAIPFPARLIATVIVNGAERPAE